MTRRPRPTPRRRSFARQHGPAAIGLLASLVVAVAAGPSISAWIGDELRRDDTIVPLASPIETETETGTGPDDPTDPIPTGPGPIPPPAVPTDPPIGSSTAPVVTIQTVPATSDVVLEIDGRRVATDATGAVEVGPADADATVRFIGTVADPPIEQIDLALWSDGSTQIERSLATIDGPVATMGLEVSSRVLVAPDGQTPPRAVATFTSDLGPVDIPVDEPTWVTAAVVERSADGLVARPLSYELAEISSTTVPDGQVFRPTPEATWRITT